MTGPKRSRKPAGQRRGRYLTGQAGAAAYAAAARRNTTARGDPQRTPLPAGPPPDPRLYRDDMMTVCCCHDTKGEHRLDDDTGQRGACTVATADGPCGCRRFTPRRTVTEGEGTPDVHQRP